MLCSYSEFVNSVLGPFRPILQATGIPIFTPSTASTIIWSCVTFMIVFQSEFYILTAIIITYKNEFFTESLSADSSGVEKLNFLIFSVAGFTLDTLTHVVLIRTFADTLKTCWDRLERIHNNTGYSDLSKRRGGSVNTAFVYVMSTVIVTYE